VHVHCLLLKTVDFSSVYHHHTVRYGSTVVYGSGVVLKTSAAFKSPFLW